MGNNGESEVSVNSIIATALESAGVPAQSIELPSEPEQVTTPSLDGLPKPPTKGELPGEAEANEPPGAKAKESAEAKPDEPIVQPLGKAEIEAAINQATAKFQSIMDKKINTLTYQMQQTVDSLNQFFQSQEDANISGLPENEQVLKRLQRLEKGDKPTIQIKGQQPIEQQPVDYVTICNSILETVGLGADDKRLDWAKEPGITVEVGFERFKTSVKNALLEDQKKGINELKESGVKEINKLRKKTGVDKVGNAGPSGAGLPDVSTLTPMQKIELGYQINEQLAETAK